MEGREKVVKFEGRLKSFRLRTFRTCRVCDLKVYKTQSGDFRCPEHGLLDFRKTKRLYFARVMIDAFERDSNAVLDTRAIRQLLETAQVSFGTTLDRLKGLQSEAWLTEWKNIAQKVDALVDKHYIQPRRAEVFNAILYPSGDLEIRSVSRTGNKPTKVGPSGEVFRGSRFTEADEKSFYEVTRAALPGHSESKEIWVETLVLHYKKKINGYEIDVGIRAPFKQYGKAYHIWFRMNGVHFYPVSTYMDESTGQKSWVYRVYHTTNWKENLTKRLGYLRNLEDRALKVVDAARQIPQPDARKELIEIGCSEEEIEDFLTDWKGGSLWDLVSILSIMSDRKYVIALLQKHGLLEEPHENN